MDSTVGEVQGTIANGQRLKELGALVVEFANRHFELDTKQDAINAMQILKEDTETVCIREEAKKMRDREENGCHMKPALRLHISLK